MNNLLKNKAVLGVAVILIIIAIFAGGFLLLSSKKTPKPTQSDQQEQILSLSPDEIGLSLAMSADGHNVIMGIEKTEDISSIDYELGYTSEGDIPRGAIGNIKPEGKKVKKEIPMGTCSDVCHYDKGVSNIKIILKVTKTDGKIYQVEKTLEN